MKRMEENQIKLAEFTNNHHRFSNERSKIKIAGEPVDLLTQRATEAIAMQNGVDVSFCSSSQEDKKTSVILLGSGIAVKNSVRPTGLPKVEKLPPYTTWIFLDRNQRMAEDQSVVGRRRIYYDRNGGEALICSDSEEEAIDEEEDNNEFVESEDYIICMTIKQVGSSDIVYDTLAKRLSRKPAELKARYEALVGNEIAIESSKSEDTNFMSSFLDKSLEEVQDSYDNLFCRRCLIFDCKLHGCSQELIFPAVKPSRNETNEENVPCGPDCYLQVQKLEDIVGTSPLQINTEETATLQKLGSLSSLLKKGKKTSSSSPKSKSLNTRRPRRKDCIVSPDFESWRTLEKDLFRKGLEIFGRNSCLIARNLMGELKTCVEVFHVLKNYENKPSSTDSNNRNSVEDGSNVESNENMGTTLRTTSKVLRRRSKVRRLKQSWKSAGYPLMRKRISEKKDLPCRQYNPCGCQSICRDDCCCLISGTTCEKYCGCPRTCKIRFRGCHCAKSQCRSRQCPCFAANRECDPDVCRHCWISCGDGTLGTPGHKGDNYECRNMKLLLRQQQRVLLGKSEVSGWGAFLKDSVPKHEYLGEYTGELISHHEADKRGKIYDRENSSFLFNLNDQFVLDAHRKGDKLKFANHSPNPNCYAKVMMVAGDHRVGIFAKERITAGEELFYDYRYEPDRAPAWAKKPGDPGLKKVDTISSGRAKKIA
uniref:histone-lysine N-methyltransferase CLF-like n=1 Tax=Erigeron canadensis TaxID=72917 RepID=UPI001CB945D7|nr:histone-lysine N-methyltransferase CLF-like [Erigeron canadensis]